MFAGRTRQCAQEEGLTVESFEDIQQKEFEHLTGEIGALGRRLVELGWSRDQVLGYVTQLLNSRWTQRLEIPRQQQGRINNDTRGILRTVFIRRVAGGEGHDALTRRLL